MLSRRGYLVPGSLLSEMLRTLTGVPLLPGAHWHWMMLLLLALPFGMYSVLKLPGDLSRLRVSRRRWGCTATRDNHTQLAYCVLFTIRLIGEARNLPQPKRRMRRWLPEWEAGQIRNGYQNMMLKLHSQLRLSRRKLLVQKLRIKLMPRRVQSQFQNRALVLLVILVYSSKTASYRTHWFSEL